MAIGGKHFDSINTSSTDLANSSQGERPLILIVEDQPIAREALAEMLRLAGYRIKVVETAEKAVQALAEHPDTEIAAILMDITMPHPPDGIEAARQIQMELEVDVPIIFVTAFAHNLEFQRRVEEANLRHVDWVDKPLIRKNYAKLIQLLSLFGGSTELKMMLESAIHDWDNQRNTEKIEQLISSHSASSIAQSIQDILTDHSDRDIREFIVQLNFCSYKHQKPHLTAYEDQFVAFLNGELVGRDSDREQLINTVFEKTDRTDIFIAKITKNPPKRRGGGPRRRQSDN